MENEGEQPGSERQRRVTPVAYRVRRRIADQQIADHPAAKRRDKRDHHHTQQIETAAHRAERALDREDNRAGQIGGQNQRFDVRRYFSYRQCRHRRITLSVHE
jgi:hypothetical protein